MKARAPLVTVLIPTWNNVEELLACLESLRALKYPRECLEIVVFDNGSGDGTAERVRGRFGEMAGEGWARLAFQRSDRNLGSFGGRAAGLAAAAPEAEFILSLDDDVEIAPDALAVLLEAMEDARVGVVGARIVYHDAPDEVANAAGYWNPWLGILQERVPATRTACDFVLACGCLIRHEALRAAGGFDGDLFTSHGDVDVCLKIRARGYAVLYEPAAVVRHRVHRGGTRTPERVYYGYRNKLVLVRRHVPAWWRPVVLALYAGLWLPKILLGSLAHHRGVHRTEVRAILLAVLDGALGRRGEARWFAGPRG